MERTETVLMSVFVSLEAVHAFSAFLPSIFTIRTFGAEAGTQQAIRDGELLATGFAILLGLVTSRILKSSWPILLTVASSFLMISVYEYALRTRTETGDTYGNS